jgi:hypothetical protein
MLINLRNALMAGKRKPTAKDYVQSGLVAMWDGIENAGYGIHNASATTWKNLASNSFDATIISLTSVAYWESDGFRYNKTTLGGTEYYFYVSSNTGIQQNLGNNYTVGFTGIIYPGSKRNYNGFMGDGGDNQRGFTFDLWDPDYLTFAVDNSSTNRGKFPFVDVPLSSQLPLPVAVVVVCNAGTISAYSKGIFCGTATTTVSALGAQGCCIGASYDNNNSGRNSASSSFYRTPLAKFNRAFVYNRALTAQEILTNYKIDKARFNLP